MTGYIKINRQLFSQPFWEEERCYSKAEAWIDIITSACHSRSLLMWRGRYVNVARGEMKISLRFLCTRWRWSVKKVANFLTALVDMGLILWQKGNSSMLSTLTVVDYDSLTRTNGLGCRMESNGNAATETLQTSAGKRSQLKSDTQEQHTETTPHPAAHTATTTAAPMNYGNKTTVARLSAAHNGTAQTSTAGNRHEQKGNEYKEYRNKEYRNNFFNRYAAVFPQAKPSEDAARSEKRFIYMKSEKTFMDYYLRTKGCNYYWSGKDARSLAAIVGKLQTELGGTAGAQEIAGAFARMLDCIDDQWLLDRLSPAMLNNQFNRLLQKLKRHEYSGNANSCNNSTGCTRQTTRNEALPQRVIEAARRRRATLEAAGVVPPMSYGRGFYANL